MSDSKRLREELKELDTELVTIARTAKDEGRDLTEPEIKRFDDIRTEKEHKIHQLASVERFELADSLFGKSDKQPRQPFQTAAKVITRYDRAKAFAAWALNKGGFADKITRTEMEAAEKCNVNLNGTYCRAFLLDDDEVHVRRDSTDQITHPENGENDMMIQGVQEALYAYNDLYNVCELWRTPNGNRLPWTVIDDYDSTANAPVKASARAKGETIVSTGLDLAQIYFTSWNVGSGAYPIAWETLRDSAVSLLPIVSRIIGTRIARKEAEWFVSGAGTTEPQGLEVIFDNPDFTFALGDDSTSQTHWNKILVELEYAVEKPYRKNGVYMFGDTVAKSIKLSKDKNNRPLFRESVNRGDPVLLNEKPFIVVPEMTDNYILFGDPKMFLIRAVQEVSITVLKERWAEDNCLGIVGTHSCDSGYLQTSAFSCAASTDGTADYDAESLS